MISRAYATEQARSEQGRARFLSHPKNTAADLLMFAAAMHDRLTELEDINRRVREAVLFTPTRF